MTLPVFDPKVPLREAIADSGFDHLPCVTNLSVNGAVKTQYGIATAGHPFYRLKMAENTIADKRSTLRDIALQRRKHDRQKAVDQCQLRLWQEELAALQGEGTDFELQRCKLQRDIGNLEDELAAGEIEDRRFADMLRDTQLELAAAEEERAVLLEQYPDFEKLSYGDLQNIAGNDALLDRLAKVSAAALLRQQGLPEEVASLALELAPETYTLILKLAQGKAQAIQPVVQLLAAAGDHEPQLQQQEEG